MQKQKALVRDHYLDASETWLALDGDTPLGFIGLLDAFIGGLFVAPAAHGRGIGRQLVEHAATLKGALEVEVYAANREALGFYARCGFVESGRRPRDDEDARWRSSSCTANTSRPCGKRSARRRSGA